MENICYPIKLDPFNWLVKKKKFFLMSLAKWPSSDSQKLWLPEVCDSEFGKKIIFFTIQ